MVGRCVQATLTRRELYLHLSVLLPYLIGGLRARGGPALDRAVAQAEARAVAAALDRLAVELTGLRERAATVRAAVVDRVHVLAVAHEQARGVAHVRCGRLVRLEGVGADRLGPLVRPLVERGLVGAHALAEREV